MKLAVISGICGLLVCASTAMAQVAVGTGFVQPYGFQARAATAGESYARGGADLMRAAGEANLMNSQAVSNLQDAQSKQLDNQMKYTETYFAKRQVNQSYRDEQRRRVTDEDLFRYGQQSKPKPLGPGELDPVTGDIHWPLLLRQPVFADDQEVVSEAFKGGVSNRHLKYDDYGDLQKTIKHMQDELVGMIKEVPTRDYMEASRFLRSLMEELRQLAG